MDTKEICLKQNIVHTREAMGEKIELLESRIHKALEAPKSVIDTLVGSIDQIKSSVDETKMAIDSGFDTLNRVIEETSIKAKSTADYIAQLEQDPWIMFGSAILMGYAIGSLNRGDLWARRHAYPQLEESR